MEFDRLTLGIDVGSVSVKVAVCDADGRILKTSYCRFQGRPFQTLKKLLEEEFPEYLKKPIRMGTTGIGGRTCSEILGGRFFGEITALATANYDLVPQAVTVIEMGGEDSKFLQLDSAGRAVLDFSMNNICAAGTGSFLDQQAGRLKISIENEFGQLALKSQHPPRIAGRCSVFAKSDMIHLQQIATPDYDIVAGLCFAVARNFKSAIARGKKFIPPVAFEGGVAANPGVVRAFKEILEIEDSDLIIPEYFNVMGAIGAARLAGNSDGEAGASIDTEKITAYLNYRETPNSERERLTFDYPDSKFYGITNSRYQKRVENLEVYLGIDVGSLSTNLALIDLEKNVVARRYLMTEGRPIEAVRRGLAEIGEEIGGCVKVIGVGTTGSGRYLTGDFVGADIIKNEITAQATAAINIDPSVDTIFEIGGQDSKYISLQNKTVIDFEMNKACAAGTGSFLQEQAEKLAINIEREFGDRALQAQCPVGCGERCTVFMESDLVSHQRRGAQTDDIIAGLAYSIASNYLTKVVGDRRIGDNIFFQGGVAWNKGVVAAFEKLTGKKITVPPHHDITGAIGAAILAMESDRGQGTKFKGFDLSRRHYSVSTFTCEDCSNMCEIRQVDVEGENPLYYGSRCEKYDIRRQGKQTRVRDYFAMRQRLQVKNYLERRPAQPSRGRVGIPRVLHFFEFYPFWKAFFDTIGYEIVNSDHSNHEIVETALEKFAAETCFPVKMTFGHVDNLIKKGVDFIFLPGLVKSTQEGTKEEGNSICPYVQSIFSTIAARFDFDTLGVKLLGFPIRMHREISRYPAQMKLLARELKLSDKDIETAVTNGLKAYDAYRRALCEEGEKILAEIKPEEKCLVIVSRPYNGFDRRLSLDIPEKIRRMGIKAIPIDFLPLRLDTEDLSSMYWLYGRKIMSASAYIRRHPNLFAVYLTSFGCGPDSFITHFFRRSMTGKPYLQLEMDEHSADAGMITRVEAFLDSLRFYNFAPPVADFTPVNKSYAARDKFILIPRMCDHAYAVRAAFERCGLKAKVMDEPNQDSLFYGKKFTSGKECFPCTVTTGDMLREINRPGFERGKAIFFMPGADGPCRFGQYSQLHRMILDDLGYGDIPIYSPNSRTSYADFGLEKTDFRKAGWAGIVFVDNLIKCLLKIRPYETVSGSAEEVYQKFLGEMQTCLISRGDLKKLAINAARAFAAIKTVSAPRPQIGLVGEIYLRNNRFSNNHLIAKLEALGAEVQLATFGEWVNYTSHTFYLDSVYKKNYKGVVHAKLQAMYQHRVERRLEKQFRRHVDISEELDIAGVISMAAPYLPVEIRGEAVLSIGKAIDFAGRGACGIINCMPFNCMPGTIVSSLSRKISQDLGDMPWLNMSYEGLQDSGEETRLEAFVDQARSRARQQQKIIQF